MSHYPPPGAPDSTPPPPPGGPSYAAHPTYGAQPSYGPPAGPPAWGPPVHQPGVVPLRPLTLGDIFGGALQVIRRNPKATVGMALLVSFGFMLLPILGTVVLGAGDLLPAVDVMDDSTSTSMGTTDLGFLVSTMISGVFSGLSTLVITGLIVRVVEQAVVGRRITAGEAWAASKGRLLPLLGLTLLVASGMLLVIGLPVGAAVAVGLAVGDTVLTVVLVVLASLLALVLTFFVYVRYVLLAAPALVLEGTGVLASFSRAAELSRGQFWRIFGIYFLANLAASFVGQVIAIPFAILGVVSVFVLPSGWALAGMLLTSHVSTILTGALIGPFTAGVLVLQYLDQRFRKEGLDIELLNSTLGTSAGTDAPGRTR